MSLVVVLYIFYFFFDRIPYILLFYLWNTVISCSIGQQWFAIARVCPWDNTWNMCELWRNLNDSWVQEFAPKIISHKHLHVCYIWENYLSETPKGLRVLSYLESYNVLLFMSLSSPLSFRSLFCCYSLSSNYCSPQCVRVPCLCGPPRSPYFCSYLEFYSDENTHY